MIRRRWLVVTVAALTLVGAISVGILQPGNQSGTATVQFFSNGNKGYACFLSGVQNEHGGPYCMSDDPATMLPSSAAVPLGSYTILFFPFGTASNQTLWLATNNIHVTGTGAYGVSISYANVTVDGDGAIVVFMLPDNVQPASEFSGIGVMAFSALATSLYLLRRRP
ncbi:MAG: hypothetical protein ABSC50_03230 [Candidatus Bathyarchaeia archaeon]